MAKSNWNYVKSHFDDIKKWLQEGLYEKDIIKNLGIGKTAWENYKNKYKELSELLLNEKLAQNELVENALYKNATGYSYIEEQAFKCKEVYYDDEGKRCEKEEVKKIEVVKYKFPETEAAKYWLKNRAKKEWADNPQMIDLKKEQIEIEKQKMELGEFK